MEQCALAGIYRTLLLWLGVKTGDDLAGRTAGETTAAENYEDEDAIVLKVNPEIADLMPAYLEKRRKDIAKITAALDSGDFQGIAQLSHKIKGSAGGYGFDQFAGFARLLESAAKDKDPHGIRDSLDLMLDYLDRVKLKHE